MLDNMIKSVYGTLLLIIQAFSSEEHNIYTLMGRARRNRRNNRNNRNDNRNENRIQQIGSDNRMNNRNENRIEPVDNRI